MGLVLVVECRHFLDLKIAYCEPRFSCVYIHIYVKIEYLNVELCWRVCAQLSSTMKENIVLTSLHEIKYCNHLFNENKTDFFFSSLLGADIASANAGQISNHV